MLLDAIHAAIGQLGDPAARARLEKCVPMLAQAVDNWDDRSPHGLTIAACTPANCVIFAADGWRVVEETKLDKGVVALAVVQAIESAPTPEITGRILTGLSVLLGHAGIAAQLADQASILARGQLPLTVGLAGSTKARRSRS